MLPREKRVRNERDFKRIYQKGSFFSVGSFTLNFLPNRMSFSRLGIVVSKKAESKATDRNQTKRRFREASRKLYDILPPGYDVIVTIKKTAKGRKFTELEKEVSEAFKKIKAEK